MIRRFFAAALAVALIGCEQESQSLPFDVSASVTKTFSSAGGTVSTPAGAAVHFSEGSLAGTTNVTVAETSVPAELSAGGTAASSGFRVDPVNTPLFAPTKVELKLTTTDPDAWLATVVSSAGGTIDRYGSRVDLSTGLVSTDEVDRLATFAAVIPPATAVYRVFARSAAPQVAADAGPAAAQSVAAIVSPCGDATEPCDGLAVTATQNLLDLVEEAAAVYPEIVGSFTVTNGVVGGTIEATAAVRIKLESGQTAETVEVVGRLEPTAGTVVTETASEVVFSNVLHRISGSTEDDAETVEVIAPLVVKRNGSAGYVTIDRSFQIEKVGGRLETASLALTFPVNLQF